MTLTIELPDTMTEQFREREIPQKEIEAKGSSISHSREEETPEAKARWFQSLSMVERMEMLCFFTDLILENNPGIVDARDAQPTTRRIRVLSKA